uniref:Uncharacterized protein n=1 Tax=Megaselia scalaris TaxID=36166 RepID=T1H5H2_MEGSC
MRKTYSKKPEFTSSSSISTTTNPATTLNCPLIPMKDTSPKLTPPLSTIEIYSLFTPELNIPPSLKCVAHPKAIFLPGMAPDVSLEEVSIYR